MKTLGLIGGTTWHSTLEYYRALNEGVAQRIGGLSSAQLLLHSVNFAENQPPVDEAGWQRLAKNFGDIAAGLEKAGADCILLCANTPHRIAGEVQARVSIPLLHIGDATADAIARAGIDTVALLGTRPTMEQTFITDRLAKRGIRALVPRPEDRTIIHATVLEELGRGIFLPEKRDAFARIIAGLVAEGARGVILGCTEFPLLVKPEDVTVPLFDTLALHVEQALDFALAD
jgi:aspartate racemase